MRRRVSVLFAALALAVALPGTVTAATAVEDQRTAILDCKRIRGIGGAAYIEQSRRSANTSMTAQIVPYDRVTTLDASAINACAAGRLGLAPASGELVSRNRTVVRSVRAPAGYRGASCGRNPSILYRGDLYCQRASR